MLKKHYIMLLLVAVFFCVISSVSAVDQVGLIEDDLSTSFDEESYGMGGYSEVTMDDKNHNLFAGKSNDSVMSKQGSDDILSGYSVYSYQYSIKISDENIISSENGGKVIYYMEPYKMIYWDNYNFKFVVYDNQQVVFESETYKSDSNNATAGNYQYTFTKNSLKPGTYTIAAVNNADNKIMDSKTLKVIGTAIITANDFKGNYNSGTMVAKVTDAKGLPLTAMSIKVIFSKGKNNITKYYKTNSNGYISFTPPVGVGTWSVTFCSAFGHVIANTVQKTATIKKASVKIKVYKVTEYKGFKLTLKAKITSNGKNVNEGAVTFKINGKTYKATVKNGIAIKKINLKKVKTYKYSAKFTSSNFKDSKKANSKAILKKRVGTRIIMRHYTVYSNVLSKIVTVKIKTTNGKNVNDGKIKIRSNGITSYAVVKNGKFKVSLYGLGMKHFKGFRGNTEIYKKYIRKTAKLKYIPSSHKYKSSSKKVKLTSKFKCPACGKTKTHNHYAVGYFYTHKQIIKVV